MQTVRSKNSMFKFLMNLDARSNTTARERTIFRRIKSKMNGGPKRKSSK